MALKVLKIFSLLWQSFTGVNYSIWIAFLPYLNNNSNVGKNLDAMEKNLVHFLIQQP